MKSRSPSILLIGESALPEAEQQILDIAGKDPAIQQANGVLTVHMGPKQIVAGLSIEFEDHLAAPEIEACVERIETAIRQANPDIVSVFVKPQTASSWKTRRQKIVEGYSSSTTRRRNWPVADAADLLASGPFAGSPAAGSTNSSASIFWPRFVTLLDETRISSISLLA